MKPVIMAVADALKDNYYDYNPNSNSLYFDAIYYLASYSKDSLKNKYKDKYGNVKQIKMYDDYGRKIGWVDYTNHGYGNIDSPD